MQQLFRNFTGLPVGVPFQRPHQPNILMPDNPFFAVGDIHGHATLLDDILARIGPKRDDRIVFLGDYIDRGPASFAVLKKLFALSQDRPDRIVCLMGNHERMMLDFIDDPLGVGVQWLRCGGRETLASFGVQSPIRPTPDETLDLCAAFEDVIPRELLAWLRQLPLIWQTGNMWCVHAGMDPLRPPNKQKSSTFLWGHPAFMAMPRSDDLCVVHAHTVVSQPTNYGSRIALDTGAYKTGQLTAAFIDQGRCSFISTQT